MVYFSRHLQRTLRFSSLPLKLDRLLSLPKGWKISCGFWLKYTVDNPGVPPSTFSGGSFLYSELMEGEIRLLRILPGKEEDVVETELVTVELLNAPSYEALSYVWGAFNERSFLRVDGCPVEIHTGLFDAIHAIRSPNSERLVWADAICINQSQKAIAERIAQVRIMGQIYEAAKNVVAYLGRPTERTENGMRVLRSFTETSAAGDEPPWLDSALPELEQSLADILNRTWFERIWTVQEATLAQHMTLMCGKHQISWCVNLRTMRKILVRIKLAVISPYFSAANFHEYTYENTLDWAPLVNLLETQMRQAARRERVVLRRNQLDLAFDFRHRRSTDPRDKYFAILGIIENDEGGRLAIAPDYSIGLEELHRWFTAEIQRIAEIEDVRLPSPVEVSSVWDFE